MKFCQLARIRNRVRSGPSRFANLPEAAEKFVLALRNHLSNTTKLFYLNGLNVCWRANWQRNFGAQNSIWQPNGSGIWRRESACKTRIDSPGRIGIVRATLHRDGDATQTYLHHLSIDIIALHRYIAADSSLRKGRQRGHQRRASAPRLQPDGGPTPTLL